MKAITNTFLKVISVCIILIFTTSINLNADEQQQGPKFPGKLGLESKILAEGAIKNSQPAEVTDNNPNDGGNGGKNYFRFELKPSITFTPLSFYNIGLWVKDRMDLRMYEPNAANTSGKLDTSAIDLKARNRFYTGLDNIFIIQKIMTIDAGFELRLGNDLNNGAGLNPKSSTSNAGLEVRLTPYLNLSGKYDFGFSWKLNTAFEFYLYPALYQFADYSIDDQKKIYGSNYDGSDKNKLFQSFSIEIDKLSLGYEFFHFFAPKEIQCTFTYEMYMFATIYNPDYQNQYNDWNYTKQDDRSKAKVKSNMMNIMKNYIGFNFNFWGFQPYVGFYFIFDQSNGSIWNASYIDAKDQASTYNKSGVYTNFRPGIKAGFSYKKDWLELGIGYTGVILVSSTDPLWSSSKIAKYTANTVAAYNWENYITSYLSIKL